MVMAFVYRPCGYISPMILDVDITNIIRFFSRRVSADGRCSFPAEWHGNWFGSHDGDVTITSSLFSTKGTCVDRKHDFFLIENKLVGII